MAAYYKSHFSVTSTTTETDFAAASDVDSIIDVTLFGPANWGEIAEFVLYAKRDPAAAAAARERIVLNGPITLQWLKGVPLLDGWRISHKKLSSGSNPTVAIEIAGVQ